MAAIDVHKLIDDINDAATGVLVKDVKSLRGYSKGRVEALAKQAKFIADGIISGEITENTRDFFLKVLRTTQRILPTHSVVS